MEGVVEKDIRMRVNLVNQFKSKGISDNFGRITIETWKVHDGKDFSKIAMRLLKLLSEEIKKMRGK